MRSVSLIIFLTLFFFHTENVSNFKWKFSSGHEMKKTCRNEGLSALIRQFSDTECFIYVVCDNGLQMNLEQITQKRKTN